MSVIDNIYAKIINAPNLSDNEKANLLHDIHKEIEAINDKDFDEAKKNFKYCNECGKFYSTDKWIKNQYIQRETSRRKYPYDPEDWSYETYMGIFKASICPEGHTRIEQEI